MAKDEKLRTLISEPGNNQLDSEPPETPTVPHSSDEALARPSSLAQPPGAIGGLARGELVKGRFRIEALAESGGMGDIYRARDLVSGRAVALKALRSGSSSDPRFRREVEVLSRLQHPGVVAYVDHGVLATGQPFLAMEWLEGLTLGATLRQRRLGARSAVRIAQGIAEAIGAAHELGVVHRDLNPSNVFLVEGDPEDVRVLDFGVARDGSDLPQLTREGTQLGTPGYMAPEQVEGSARVSSAIDVFALGCLLHEMLTGERAFHGLTIQEVLVKILSDQPPSADLLVPDIPREVAELTRHLLEKDPKQRPPDGTAVARLLASLPALTDEPPSHTEPVAVTQSDEQRIGSVIAFRDEPEGTFARAALAAEAHGLVPVRCADETVAIVSQGPGTATDHATRAARCALSVQRATRAKLSVTTGLSRQQGQFPAGRALETAIVSLLVRDPGDAGSKGSSILLDENTALLLDSRFEVRQGERGFLLRGVRETHEPARTVLGRRTRCVGRRREMGMLSAMLAECIEDSCSGGVLITGATGIGKSRLAYEVSRLARRGRQQVRVIKASADSMSQGVPYYVFAQACQRACGIEETLTEQARRAQLRIHLGGILPPEEEERVSQFLQEVMFPPPAAGQYPQLEAARRDSRLRGDQIKRALGDWLDAECQRAPVLLILDDLQWADLSSIQLVDGLLRRLSERPLVLVAIARPEIHDVHHELWTKRGVTELRLGGLSRRAATEMVVEILGQQPEAKVTERVLTRAQGNPFWIEELLRAEKAGRGEDVPDQILLLAQSRIGELDSHARRVLRAAAVFGQNFWLGGVRYVLDAELARPLSKLSAELVEAELIVRRDLSRFADEDELQFASGLLRDAAYSLLSDDQKERAHARAAEWLEKLGEVEALPIAMHFALGGEQERARPHYVRAAREALSGNDFEAVRSCVEEGLSGGAQGGLAVELHLLSAEAARWQGDNSRALRAAKAALTGSTRGSASWFRAAGEACVLSAKSGRPSQCVALASDLLQAEFGAGGEGTARVIALCRVATQLVHLGELDLSRRLVQAASLEEARVQPEPEAAGFIRAAQAALAEATGDPVAHIENAEQAADQFEDAGDLRNACSQRINLGSAQLQFGDTQAALVALRAAAELSEKLQLENLVPVARMHLGRALCRRGDVDEGLTLLDRAAAQFDRHKNMTMAAWSRMAIAEGQLARGQLDLAEDAVIRARAIAGKMRPVRASAQALLVLILLESGQASQAGLEMEKLLGEFETAGGPEQTLLRLAHAETLQAQGLEADARQVLEDEAVRLRKLAAGMNPSRASLFLSGSPERRRLFDLLSPRPSRPSLGALVGEPLAPAPPEMLAAVADATERLGHQQSPSAEQQILAKTCEHLATRLERIAGSRAFNYPAFAASASLRRSQQLSNQETKPAGEPPQVRLAPLARRLLDLVGLAVIIERETQTHLKGLELELARGHLEAFSLIAPCVARFLDTAALRSFRAEEAALVSTEQSEPAAELHPLLRRAYQHLGELETTTIESERRLLLKSSHELFVRVEQLVLQPILERIVARNHGAGVLQRVRLRLPPLFALGGWLLARFLTRRYFRELKPAVTSWAPRTVLELSRPEWAARPAAEAQDATLRFRLQEADARVQLLLAEREHVTCLV